MSIPEIIIYITELPRSGFFLGLKIFFIILSLFLIAGIIYFILITDWYEKRFGADLKALRQGKSREKISKMAAKLKKIKKKFEKGKGEPEQKLAIIEAATLLGKILAKQGFKGESLLDQIEKAGPDVFSPENLEELLEAYQVGSAIVNDPDYKLSPDKAKKTIEVFEKTIQDLSAI